MSSEEENIQPSKKCWKCGWVISDTQLLNIWGHSCFSLYDETKDVIEINDNGVISIGRMTRKKKKFTEDIRLITSVSKRPCLFKKSQKYTASNFEKENFWDEVANETSIEYSAEKAKARWKSLRDQYKRAQFYENSKRFRHGERMQFLDQDTSDDEPSAKLPLREKSKNSKRADEVLILQRSKKSEDFNAKKASEHAALRYASGIGDTSEESDAPIESREDFSNSVHDSSTSQSAEKHVPEKIPANRRKNTVKDDKRLQRKEELQMLVLEKIRSHKVERTEPSDMFLFSLAETFKKLDHRRQLRVHRRFVEILEAEYNEQEYTRTQHEDS